MKDRYKRAVAFAAAVWLLIGYAAGNMGNTVVRAAETGTITSLSEKVYEDKDTESNAIANVIMDGIFTILSAESDAEGGGWYLIETDMGVRGYIPAQNVILSGQDNNGADSSFAGHGGQVRTFGSINVRSEASTDAEVMGEIPQDTVVEYSDIRENETGEIWYEVTYHDIHGYIKGSTVDIVESSAEGAEGDTVGEADTEEDSDTVQAEAPVDSPQPVELSQPVNLPQPTGISGREQTDLPEAGDTFEEIQETSSREEGSGQPQDFESDLKKDSAETAAGENTGRPGKTDRGFMIDGVVVFAFAGCLLCLAATCHLIRQARTIARGNGNIPGRRKGKKRKGKKG